MNSVLEKKVNLEKAAMVNLDKCIKDMDILMKTNFGIVIVTACLVLAVKTEDKEPAKNIFL